MKIVIELTEGEAEALMSAAWEANRHGSWRPGSAVQVSALLAAANIAELLGRHTAAKLLRDTVEKDKVSGMGFSST